MKFNEHLRVYKGVFVKEISNRFRCIGVVNGDYQICYVSSSNKLSRFADFSNRLALFIKVKKQDSSIQYQLLAIKYGRQFVCVNTVIVNTVIRDSFQKRLFAFVGPRKNVISEKYIEGYKADLFVHDTNTLVEIKSIIDMEKVSMQPSINSERALKQLDKLASILKKGYNVIYLFAGLCPWIETIQIDNNSIFSEKLQQCMKLGMQVRGVSLKVTSCSIDVYHQLRVSFFDE